MIAQTEQVQSKPQLLIVPASPVKPEYTNYTLVAQVLSWGYDEDFTGRISHHSFQYLADYEILHYLVDGTKDYIVTVDQFNAGLEAISTDVEPQYTIAATYDREDGTSVDVVLKSSNSVTDGMTVDCRHCWIEETLDDHVCCLQTLSGTVVKSNWRTARNNKWLTAYRLLWEARNNEQIKSSERGSSRVQDDDVEYISQLEEALCYADLAGW